MRNCKAIDTSHVHVHVLVRPSSDKILDISDDLELLQADDLIPVLLQKLLPSTRSEKERGTILRPRISVDIV